MAKYKLLVDEVYNSYTVNEYYDGEYVSHPANHNVKELAKKYPNDWLSLEQYLRQIFDIHVIVFYSIEDCLILANLLDLLGYNAPYPYDSWNELAYFINSDRSHFFKEGYCFYPKIRGIGTLNIYNKSYVCVDFLALINTIKKDWI